MTIIGQDKLLNKINSYTLDNFPRSIIIQGEKGSGKSLICDYIRSFLSNFVTYNYVELGSNFESSVIDDMYSSNEPVIYKFDGRKMDDKHQYTLLKILEEPPVNIVIIIEIDTSSDILDTIHNRCQVFELSKYSKDTLKENFLGEGVSMDVLEFCKTPGDMLSLSNDVFKDITELANKILSSIKKSNYPSIFNIVSRFNDFDEVGNLPFDIFVRIFESIVVKYCELHSIYDIYELTNEFINNLNQRNCVKSRLFEKYLFELKGVIMQHED